MNLSDYSKYVIEKFLHELPIGSSPFYVRVGNDYPYLFYLYYRDELLGEAIGAYYNIYAEKHAFIWGVVLHYKLFGTYK